MSVVLTADKEVVHLGVLVEKLPRLERLKIKFNGSFFYEGSASYWEPLKDLTPTLQNLHFSNHHGGREGGQIRTDRIFQALLAWGAEGPNLRSFKVDGSMSLSLARARGVRRAVLVCQSAIGEYPAHPGDYKALP